MGLNLKHIIFLAQCLLGENTLDCFLGHQIKGQGHVQLLFI